MCIICIAGRQSLVHRKTEVCRDVLCRSSQEVRPMLLCRQSANYKITLQLNLGLLQTQVIRLDLKVKTVILNTFMGEGVHVLNLS